MSRHTIHAELATFSEQYDEEEVAYIFIGTVIINQSNRYTVRLHDGLKEGNVEGEHFSSHDNKLLLVGEKYFDYESVDDGIFSELDGNFEEMIVVAAIMAHATMDWTSPKEKQ